MSEPARLRRPNPAAVTVPEPPPPAAVAPKERKREAKPFLLDFFPLEGEKETRLSRFFVRLAEGRLSTTRCPKDGRLLWPPRTACPHCHTEELEWVDLPEIGRIYAFSAVLAGAPLGMESEVPFSVGLVDLDGIPLRLFGRIEGRSWDGLRIGGSVRVEPYETGDGRWFYRFRASD
ncbi:MAG: Zn-ribbon domain-containing OB-fold protein [Thermoplasmata archaeon]